MFEIEKKNNHVIFIWKLITNVESKVSLGLIIENIGNHKDYRKQRADLDKWK